MNDKFLKLTNTVYKVLEFFPESDPLKNRAKDKALVIMEHLTLINEGPGAPFGSCPGWASFHNPMGTSKVKVQLLENIDIFLSYLWIGKTQGWLNSVNYLVIANEYEKIRKEIESTTELTKRLPGMGLSEQMEASEAPQIGAMPVFENVEEKKEDAPTQLNQDIKIEFIISDRQSKILEFLSKNEKAQVMDLKTILPDITKRTIRRDLDELLQAGKIVRLGDFNQVFYKTNRWEG